MTTVGIRLIDIGNINHKPNNLQLNLQKYTP